jgi:putative salt-induced outer membrane protein YdiY
MMMDFLKRINFLDKWKSNLRVGYNLYSGETDSFSNTVNFLTTRLWTKSECRFEFMQDYATSTDTDGKETVSRDKLRVSGRYRYNSTDKKIFFQAESQYGYARVSGIDQDYLQSFGCGWRIIQSEIWYFCLVPSMAGQYQVIESEQQGVSIAPTLYEEAEYKWTDTLRIHNEAYAIIPANGGNQPTYHFSIMLQNKLVGNLSLNIEYVFDFDGSVSESKDAAQQSLKASFGLISR